uniref:Uncharacterized protein n=1 Tax=viral metagenome TaxID=1070528 RepID=A0A6H1ZHN6_9ZZZZ
MRIRGFVIDREGNPRGTIFGDVPEEAIIVTDPENPGRFVEEGDSIIVMETFD